jgi:hypothetical protein
VLATRRGHVWTWDFIADATVRGGALRMLTILDEYTRECHVLHADRALRAEDVLIWLQKAIEEHGAPEHLRADNGPSPKPSSSSPLDAYQLSTRDSASSECPFLPVANK